MTDKIKNKIKNFAKLPYKKGNYNKKNWGHKIQSLCSYPSKLKPAIANVLITEFTSKGDIVLDPFCGCGTIVFEACNEGRKGIGVDLSPFAYFVSNAKANIPKKKELDRVIDTLDNYIIKNKNKKDLSEIEDEIKSFYHEETLKEILCAKEFFLKNKAHIKKNVLNFLWAATAHTLHGNRPYALSRRSHNIIPIPPKGEFKYKSLIKSLKEKINRMMISPINIEYSTGEVYNASAFNMPIKDETIDVIITSPPFLGTTEFLRQNRIRLWFAGWDLAYQKSKRSEFLEYEKTLDLYSKLLLEFKRVLKSSGLIIFHLGVIKELDMAKEINAIAIKGGFKNLGLVYEDVTKLENHGRTSRGGTHTHEFLFLSKN